MKKSCMGSDKQKYTLVGVDGNAHAIMGYVTFSMREEGYNFQQCKEYMARATSGDYNNLIRESQKMLDTLNSKNSNH